MANELDKIYNESTASSAADILENHVNEFKAAQETDEQRKARIRQDKATAALSGAIEGIGNIFNLVNASKDKAAVSVGGGAPVTEKIDAQIKENAAQRKEADDKLKAAQEKLAQVRDAANKYKFNAYLQKMDEGRKQSDEDMKQEQNEYAKTLRPMEEAARQAAVEKAQADAATAKFNQEHQQEMYDLNKKKEQAAINESYARAEGQKANAEQKKAKADHTKAVVEHIYTSGGTKVDPKMALTFNFGGENLQGTINDAGIDAIFRMNSMSDIGNAALENRLKQKYGADYKNSREYKKTPSKFTLTTQERQEALRGALIETMNSGYQYYPDVQSRIRLYLGKQNTTGDNGGNGGNGGSFWNS